ncbi:MAG: sensor histidine kinase KdpD [Silvanigrellales bacterium]|jgi:two-component system sensor histidine kinase KdpD|nr:sensor histidine kinase KdpD [Silvanigrellales bacterium]
MSVSGDDDKRPDPDRLLRAVNALETGSCKLHGHLKVFLGMSAGVGKTYAMLRAAQGRLNEGESVVVGVVETHGRPQTAALLSGLTVLPRLKHHHRGRALEEMDIDALLSLRPCLALVDELAHTNVPGSRNEKRWQDVEELLRAGIDVYTTVNIQHIESRKSVVEDFTGIRVHETVPDVFFDQADELVVIDIDPAELLERLAEGNVYQGEKKVQARENFFTSVNLTALREMALRFTAGRVERDLLDEQQLRGNKDTVHATHRLLVAVFASPYSETLLRHTKQMADSLRAAWMAVHVEDGRILSDQEKDILARNFALVGSMGGELVSTSDADPVRGLLRVARQNNVTQIVVGKSHRGAFARWRQGGSVTERLLQGSGDIDVHVVAARRRTGGPMTVEKASLDQKLVDVVPFHHTGVVLGALIFTWAVSAFLAPLLGYQAVGFLFLLAVFLSAFFLRRVPVYVFGALAGLVWNLFFIPPLYTLHVSAPEDIMMLLMFFVVALSVAGRTHTLRMQGERGREREDRTQVLFRFTRDLSLARTRTDVVEWVPKGLENACGVAASIVLPETSPSAALPLVKTWRGTFALSEKELAVAAWVLANGKAAGRGTETLSNAEGYFFPLMTDGRTLAVCALALPKTRHVPRDILAVTESIGSQAAVALEREDLRERALQVAVLEKTQGLYRALFDSVTHELRTPLAGIEGSVSAMLDSTTSGNPERMRELASIMGDSTARLRHTIDNILDMTRIESGLLVPKQETWDACEVVQAALQGTARELKGRPLIVNVPDGPPRMVCDFGLTQIALRNVLLNACLYTPAGGPIEITRFESQALQVKGVACVGLRVRDYGAGLPVGSSEQVFEKFFRAHPEQTGSLGLGLSISRGFLEAQGGALVGYNADDNGGGAIFELHLPREEP